jgi:hypothetical protein
LPCCCGDLKALLTALAPTISTKKQKKSWKQEGGTGNPLFSLKGWHNKAQGTALGKKAREHDEP